MWICSSENLLCYLTILRILTSSSSESSPSDSSSNFFVSAWPFSSLSDAESCSLFSASESLPELTSLSSSCSD